MHSLCVWIPLIALVFFGGFIGSMMSGGSILVFTVLAFLNMPVKTAIGTLKFAIAILGLFSAVTLLRGAAVSLRLTPSLTFSSVVGSILGAQIIVSLSDKVVNAIVVLLICLGTLFSLRYGASKRLEKTYAEPRGFLQVLFGFLLGIYIGTLGVASAMLAISMLINLSHLRTIEANGTSKMVIFANNLVACVVYVIGSNVDFLLGSLIAIPIAVGSWAGAKIALKMESSKLRIVFLGIAIFAIAKLLSEVI